MRILGPIALLTAFALIGTSDAPLPAQPRERFIIVGFDGMDPLVAERLISEGKLPHLAWMKEHGAMRLG